MPDHDSDPATTRLLSAGLSPVHRPKRAARTRYAGRCRHAATGPTQEGLFELHAISAFAALAQPARLAIFRLLIKHEPASLPA
jgi:hypothetical protein